MKLRALLLTVCLLPPSSVAYAQVNDSLAATSFEYYPSVENGEQPGETQLNVFRASAGIPIPVAKRTTLIAAAAYELIDVNPSLGHGFQLHAPKATFGLIQGFSESWGMMAFADVGLASDLSDDVGSDDALFSLTGIATYEFNDSFTLGAGAAYDRRTGRLAPLPAVLLNLRLGERARIRGFVPAYVNAEYRATDWLDVGLRGTFEGNRFHLGEEKFGVADLELAYSTLNLGPKLTFSLNDWVHLDVYAAGAVYRRYEIFRDDDSFAKYSLSPVLAYGARFWIGPSQWRAPSAAAPKR